MFSDLVGKYLKTEWASLFIGTFKNITLDSVDSQLVLLLSVVPER